MSSDVVRYEVGLAGYALIRHPTITVTHTTIISQYRKFTVLVRIIYTIRSFITADSATELKAVCEHYRKILSISGGFLRVNYGAKEDFLATGPDVDVSGGPHPTLLNITKIHGSKTAVLTWQLQTEKHVADDSVSPAGAWLDFIYTVATTIDQNFYATRTISGLLQLSSCHQDTRYRSADSFRHTVEYNIAALPSKGPWQRTRRDFRLSHDGKVLAFTIVDKQMYTSLPEGVTSGDLFVTTIIEKESMGKFIVRGWFEGHPNLQRGQVMDFVRGIWESFSAEVLVRLFKETDGAFWFIDLRKRVTSSWRSNRIEFEAVWSITGEFYPYMHNNLLLTVSRALQWLAWTSRFHSQPVVDLGPGGSAPVIGPKGTEGWAPIISIDPMSKMPEGWELGVPVVPPYGEGDRKEVGVGESGATRHTSWHQHFEFKYSSGRVCIPVMAVGMADVIQRAKNPELFLLVVGEAQSTGKEPEVPDHPFITTVAAGEELSDSPPQVVLLEHTITPSAPSSADEYKVSWRFLYKFNIIGESIPFKWPYTPENPELGNKGYELPVAISSMA